MANTTIPAHDFYRISEYQDGSLEHAYTVRTFSQLNDAKQDLKALKERGYSVASNQYDDGLFITKYHYNGSEKGGNEFLTSVIY